MRKKIKTGKLEQEGIYYLPHGTRVFISPKSKEWKTDTLLISEGPGKHGVGSTIHVVVNPPCSYDKVQKLPVNCEITFYDNWTIKVCGTRKDNPTFILEDDEFPSTLILRLEEGSMKVVKEEIRNEPL